MPSWQGQVLNTLLYLKSKLSKSYVPLDIVAHRLAMEKIAHYFRCKKGIMNEHCTIGHCSAEWFYRPDHNEKIILYLHGGAFVIGSTNTHRGIMAKIASLSFAKVLGINYRLAPEHPFPAGLNDALMAYQWLIQQGVSAKNIILIGDSSGANLALALSSMLEEQQLPQPAAIACLSPWLDLTLSGESIQSNAGKDPMLTREVGELAIKAYVPNQDLTSPLISPLLGDLTHLPPLYIQASSTELLFSDATRLAYKAQQSGVEVTLKIYEDMIHSWQLAHQILPEAKHALNDLSKFIHSMF